MNTKEAIKWVANIFKIRFYLRKRGGLIKNMKGLTLLREGEPIIPPSKGINFESFVVELNCKNPIDDKEIERIAEIIIKMLNKEILCKTKKIIFTPRIIYYEKRLLTKEETIKRFDDYFRDWKREIKKEEKERQNIQNKF